MEHDLTSLEEGTWVFGVDMRSRGLVGHSFVGGTLPVAAEGVATGYPRAWLRNSPYREPLLKSTST